MPTGTCVTFLGTLPLTAQMVEYPGVTHEGLATWQVGVGGRRRRAFPPAMGANPFTCGNRRPGSEVGPAPAGGAAPAASFLVLKPPLRQALHLLAPPRGSSLRNPLHPRMEPPALTLLPEPCSARRHGAFGREEDGRLSGSSPPTSCPAPQDSGGPITRSSSTTLGGSSAQHSVLLLPALSPWGWAVGAAGAVPLDAHAAQSPASALSMWTVHRVAGRRLLFQLIDYIDLWYCKRTKV